MNDPKIKNQWHNVRGITREEMEGDPEVIRKYGDILDLVWTGSKTRRHMTMDERAAQFSPFAALTGYGAQIQETARLTDGRVELTPEKKAELDNALQEILQEERPCVRITYFVPDDRKAGGSYQEISGVIEWVEADTRTIKFADKRRIAMDEIIAIDKM